MGEGRFKLSTLDVARERARKSPDGSARDTTDYAHRHLVNLVGTIVLLCIALATVWTAKAMQEYETRQACIDSGRRDCVPLDLPTHIAIRAPVR
jgi:hypothetical protein